METVWERSRRVRQLPILAILQHAKPLGCTHQVGNGQVRKRVDASLLLHRPDTNSVTQYLSVPMRSNAE